MARGGGGRGPWWVIGAVVGLGGSTEASAHGFAQRFDLPIPIELFFLAAAAAVIVSFVVVVVFAVRAEAVASYPRFDLLRLPGVRLLASPWCLDTVRVSALALFALTVAAALFGNQDPYQNLAPVMVWVLFWVGLAYVCALVGDLWRLINPWRTVFDFADGIYRRFRPGRRLGLGSQYPRWLGTWPAVIGFFAFAWFELASTLSEAPAQIGRAALVYSLVTWTGMLVFGPRAWLTHGEIFSVIFRLFAAFAPTEVRRGGDPSAAAEGDEAGRLEWCLRPPAVGLLAVRVADISMMLMVFLVVTTVTFDGFIETALWRDSMRAVLQADVLAPTLAALWSIGIYDVVAVTTVGLVLFPLAILAAYLLSVWLMHRIAPSVAFGTLALRLAVSMVPIAIGYHLAHYLSLFAVWSQLIVALASDPFGLGWDLFGTVAYQVNPGLIDAQVVWYASVVAIVIGHMVSVYVAHVLALRLYGTTGLAARSQIPLLPLMLCYTVLSLWIIAQPVIH